MSNQTFVDKWNDIWTVSMDICGIGHITARVLNNGNAEVLLKLDAVWDGLNTDRPENAESRIWTESIIEFVDADKFLWCSYTSKEGSPGVRDTPYDMFYDGETRVTPLANGLSIRNSRGTTILPLVGPEPVVPDIQLPLYACTRKPDKSGNWPLQSLSFFRNEQGRNWCLLPLNLRYAGRKGPQTGLNHAFEADLPEEIGRTFSVWTDDKGNFMGMGDEQEVRIVADDEETARALLAARSG